MKKAHYHTLEWEYVDRLFARRFHGQKVLDLGCGLGEYLRLFKKHGCSAHGVDINQQQVEALRRDGHEAYQPGDLPAGDTYDVLFMSHVIEHLGSKDMVSWFREWLPRLRPEGRVIVITPVGGHRFWHDFTHVRPYYPQSLWMLWGGWTRPGSDRLEWVLELEDICFFNDPFRIRHGSLLGRSYYANSGGGG